MYVGYLSDIFFPRFICLLTGSYFDEILLLNAGRIKALRGPRPKIFCGALQLPSLVNTRGYIKQVTIQNIFHSFRETDYSYAYTFL